MLMCIPVTNHLFNSHFNIVLPRSMNSSPMIFNPDQHHFVACSDFQSDGNQTNNADFGEITADQILAMPIVFADEALTNQKTENSSYSFTGTNKEPEVPKEKPIDKEEDMNITLTPEVLDEEPIVGYEYRQVLKEEIISEDEDENGMCQPVLSPVIPESLKIKQV